MRAGIREIAKRLVELLNDTGRIREERKKCVVVHDYRVLTPVCAFVADPNVQHSAYAASHVLNQSAQLNSLE